MTHPASARFNEKFYELWHGVLEADESSRISKQNSLESHLGNTLLTIALNPDLHEENFDDSLRASLGRFSRLRPDTSHNALYVGNGLWAAGIIERIKENRHTDPSLAVAVETPWHPEIESETVLLRPRRAARFAGFMVEVSPEHNYIELVGIMPQFGSENYVVARVIGEEGIGLNGQPLIQLDRAK